MSFFFFYSCTQQILFVFVYIKLTKANIKTNKNKIKMEHFLGGKKPGPKTN